MDSHEAKQRLQAYRPDGSDAGDPVMRESLEQAGRDPELAHWFEQERAFDEAFSQKLAQVPVPSHLKEQILAGQKVVQLPSWWERPIPYSAVAAVLIVAFVAYLFLASPFSGSVTPARAMTWNHFQTEATEIFSEPSFHLKKTTSSPEAARAWLAAHDAPGDFALPEGLRTHPTVGCTMMDMDGHRVSLICFNTGTGELVHLFILGRAAIQNPPPDGGPVFRQDGAWAMASWSEGEVALMLASKTPMPQLRQLFGGAPLSVKAAGFR